MVIKSISKYTGSFILTVLFLWSHGAGASAISETELGGEGTGTATFTVKKTFVVPVVTITEIAELWDTVTTPANASLAQINFTGVSRGQVCVKGETAASNNGVNPGFYIGATSNLVVYNVIDGRALTIADGYDSGNCTDFNNSHLGLRLKAATQLTAGTNTLTVHAKQYLP